MTWFTLHIEGPRHTLLTSDRPVIMTRGLVGPEAHLAIPISPTAIFFAVRSERSFKPIEAMGENKVIERINAGVALQAIKSVYGVDDSELRFANRLGKKSPTSVLPPFKPVKRQDSD